jgi:catechol 2,3-dioxygenase-like lactoylglutathione lyase family enzyme
MSPCRNFSLNSGRQSGRQHLSHRRPWRTKPSRRKSFPHRIPISRRENRRTRRKLRDGQFHETPTAAAPRIPRPAVTAGGGRADARAHRRPVAIALYVHDIDKSRAFYKDFVGFGEPFSLANKDGSLHLTWIKINDRQSVELFPGKEAGGDRLNHIELEVEDAEAMRLHLAARGVKVPDKTDKGKIGNFNCMIRDPDGHLVEIVQYAPGGWTRREAGKFMPDTRVYTRIAHVGILVGDLDASLKFYRDILGGSERWRGGGDPKVLSWVNVKVPEGDD